MSKKQTPLYVTLNDLSGLMNEVSLIRPLEFVFMGLSDEPEPKRLCSPKELMPFSAYLAFDKGMEVIVRKVPQRNGSMKYAVDPMGNKKTVVFHSGGMVGDQRLVAGDVSVATKDQHAEEIYALFAKEIRRKFKKIQSYYVGTEASDFFDKGIRLSPTVKSPEIYDLAR